MAGSHILERRRRDTEQLELRARTLDGRGLCRVLGVNLLQLLAARRPDLDEPLGPLQLAVMRVEHRLCRDVSSLCFGERRAVDLGQDLAPSNAVAERRPDSRHAPGDERRHHHLTIGVRLDDAGQTNLRP